MKDLARLICAHARDDQREVNYGLRWNPWNVVDGRVQLDVRADNLKVVVILSEGCWLFRKSNVLPEYQQANIGQGTQAGDDPDYYGGVPSFGLTWIGWFSTSRIYG